jgi:hypothetical protein
VVAESSAPVGKNHRIYRPRVGRGPKTRALRTCLASMRWRSSCRTEEASTHVCRTLSLSIVLLLTIGQHPGLSCFVRCDSPVPATSTCHRGDASDSALIGGKDSCNTQSPLTMALLRDDGPRSERGSIAPEPTAPRSEDTLVATDCASRGLLHSQTAETGPPVSPLRI